MNCTTKEDFNAAIEFGNAINLTHPDQTQETTVLFLNRTQESISKVDGKYTAGEATIRESVTEKISRLKPYRGRPNPLLDQQGQIGNLVHEISSVVLQDILNQIEGLSVDQVRAKLNTGFVQADITAITDKYGRGLTPSSVTSIVEGVKKIVSDIYKVQKTINSLSGKDGNVVILSEQVLIDPRRNIGGTSDILAIYSDNTASVFDLKTKILKASNKDAFGNVIDPSKLITKYDYEKYKLQIGEYGRLLRESYGVKSIRTTSIYPITIDVKFNAKTQKYATQIEHIKFPGQDPLLEKVLPFSSKTGFKELDDYILKIDDQIKKLETRIKSNPTLRESLQDKIQQLNTVKKEILLNHSLDAIIQYGKSLSDTVAKAELDKLSIVELQNLIEELSLLDNITEATFSYRKYLKNTSKSADTEETEKQLTSIAIEIKDALEAVKEVLFKDKVSTLIEKSSGVSVQDELGNFIPFAQEGYFAKWFYQLSQYDHPVFRTLKKILTQINYEVREKTDKVVEEILTIENAVEAWRIKTGRSFQDLVQIMVNPETDNFWGRYDGDYIDEIKLANGNSLYRYYKPVDDYEARYQKRFEKRKLFFENELKLTGKELDRAINKWISENDLSLENGLPKYPNAWENARTYHQLQMIDNPDKYNEHYQFILSVPELKAYYAMFEKYNKHFREILDVEYTKLPNNFLPNVRKTMSERVTEQGVNGLTTGIKDFFSDFSVREEDRSEDTTYNSNEQIPIFYLNRFRSKDGQLQIGEKSYQFGRSLAIFAKMAYNYEASVKREAEIKALQQFLDTHAEQISQSRGKNLIDQLGNPITEKLQANDLPDVFRTFVDMYIYKINTKPIFGDKSGNIEKMLLKAKEYFTLKVLGLNVVAGLGSLASAKINSIIEANKGIIYNKEVYLESLQEAWGNREKFLALNAFFDIMGHRLNNPRFANEKKYGERFYGDPTMRGWVNKYVNSRMLMNTFSIGDQYIEELVTVSMSKNYYVDQLGNLRRIKNDQERELYKDRLIYNLFSYSKEDGPKINLPEDQIANIYEEFRVAVQAGQSRIKGTIPEEDRAAWQGNIIGQLLMHFKSWMPGIMFERFGKVKYDSRIDSLYMGKYVALAKEFGNPDKLVFSEFFKKILLPRLGKLVADLATFGFLSKRRLNDVHTKTLFFEKWLDENPHQRGKISFEEFNQIQQVQLKSVIQELRVLLTLATLLVLLMGDWDEDGDKDYKQYLLSRKLASWLLKTQQEMSFVYSPVAFASMIKSPLPMLGLVSDAYKTISNTVDEILDIPFGEDRLLGGEERDKQPLLYHTHKWFLVGGVVRFFDVMNDETQYLVQQQ